VRFRMLHYAVVFALAAGSGLPKAHAQTFPERPVRLIIPFPPGGSIDTLGRILTQKLSDLWGQSAFVENRPGAGGNVGSMVAAQAAADGYTLTFGGQFLAANATIAPLKGFDPARSFDPVVLVCRRTPHFTRSKTSLITPRPILAN